jgi:hypothetical protein
MSKGTQARHDVQRMKRMYPDLSGSNFNSLQLLQDGAWAKVIIKSNYGNLMNKTVLEEIRELNNALQNITAIGKDGTRIKVSKNKYTNVLRESSCFFGKSQNHKKI